MACDSSSTILTSLFTTRTRELRFLQKTFPCKLSNPASLTRWRWIQMLVLWGFWKMSSSRLRTMLWVSAWNGLHDMRVLRKHVLPWNWEEKEMSFQEVSKLGKEQNREWFQQCWPRRSWGGSPWCGMFYLQKWRWYVFMVRFVAFSIPLFLPLFNSVQRYDLLWWMYKSLPFQLSQAENIRPTGGRLVLYGVQSIAKSLQAKVYWLSDCRCRPPWTQMYCAISKDYVHYLWWGGRWGDYSRVTYPELIDVYITCSHYIVLDLYQLPAHSKLPIGWHVEHVMNRIIWNALIHHYYTNRIRGDAGFAK